MKKIYILLAIVFTIHLTFSQTIPIDGEYRDGGRGQYTFKIKGSITLSKGIFVFEDGKENCKVYYPINFSNVQVISITTPNGKTFSNNDLVYSTNSSYYSNGIKLPINVSSNQAITHFSIEGLGYFGNNSTKFVKDTYSTSYATNGQMFLSYTDLNSSITKNIQQKVESLEPYKNANHKEKTNLRNKELEKLFKSTTTFPKITNIIFEPYGQPNEGNSDLQNLIQLASITESIQKNNSNTNINSSSNKSGNGFSNNNFKTANQLNEEYLEYQKVNNTAFTQMSKGDFLGAANTYATAGMETETYAALGGHFTTQVLSIIQNNRANKLKNLSDEIKNDLEVYEKMSLDLEQILNNDELDKFYIQHIELLDIENKIMKNANWIGNKENSNYFKITENLREKQFKRIQLALSLKTEELFTQVKDSAFAFKVAKSHFEELKYQTYNSKNSYDYNQEKYAEKIWNLINNTQISRTKFLLELNKSKIIFNEKYNQLTEMIIYLVNNFEDEEFDKRTIKNFEELDFDNKEMALALYVTIEMGMPDCDVYYFHSEKDKNTINYVKRDYKKILLLTNSSKFNYYINMKNYHPKNKDISFYEFLQYRSGFFMNDYGTNYFTYHAFKPVFDEGKVSYKKIKELVDRDIKETGKSEKQLFEEKKDCVYLDCSK